jgi:hypothetical protein
MTISHNLYKWATLLAVACIIAFLFIDNKQDSTVGKIQTNIDSISTLESEIKVKQKQEVIFTKKKDSIRPLKIKAEKEVKIAKVAFENSGEKVGPKTKEYIDRLVEVNTLYKVEVNFIEGQYKSAKDQQFLQQDISKLHIDINRELKVKHRMTILKIGAVTVGVAALIITGIAIAN